MPAHLVGWYSRRRPTSIEKATGLILDALSVAYVTQHKIGKYFVDFYVPTSRLVIECDGTYWHGSAEARSRDSLRDADLVALGYRVLRLAETTIKSGAHAPVLRELLA